VSDIEKKPCKNCEQDIVITVDGVFGRHRHPAPKWKGKYIFNHGQMVMGKWCRGSGKTP